MADNLQILIDAVLGLKNTTASKEEIKKGLPALSNQLASDKSARVNIVAGLDIPKTKSLIQTQLATITNGTNNLPTINLNVNVGAVQSQFQTAINNATKSVANTNKIPLSFDLNNMSNLKNQVETFAKDLAKLNGFSLGKVSANLSNTDALKTADIQLYNEALKQTVTLKYQLSEDGKKFDLINTNTVENTKAFNNQIAKSAQEIENTKVKYERLIADFKNSNSAIISGLSQPLSDVETKLSNIGKGTSINDLKNSFEKLKTSASEITKYLDTTNSSFNKSTNAVNNYRDMDATLIKLSTDYSNLIVKNKELDNQIISAKNSLAELQNIEKQSGTNAEWAKKYKLVNTEIKSIVTNLQLAQKAESADKQSVAQQQLKYYEKIRKEITLIHNFKKKLATAGAEESAEIQRQITNASKRISYNEKQIEKKKLYNKELFAEINALKNIYSEQERINNAKQKDKANTATAKLATDIKSELSNLSTLEQTWKKQGILVGDFKTKVEQLKTALNQVGNENQFVDVTHGMTMLRDEANRLHNTLSQQRGLEKTRQQVEILTNRISAFEATNTRALPKFGAQLEALKAKLQSVTNAADYQKVNREFQSLTAQVKAAGLAGDNLAVKLGKAIKKFAQWTGITSMVMYAVRVLRGMVKTVVEIDTAMVSLKKVTDATDAEFTRFLSNATISAKELGSSITDVINATAEFSRLGYGLPDAEALGRVATLYENVGDGITTTEASQSIISTMKAFGYEANRAEEIIDKFNEVGNNYSISSAGIGEALQHSASALAEANNDLSQSIALQVGANNVIQDVSVVGNMWKTVAMRIRGAKSELEEAGEDTEGMVESTSQLRDIIKGMTGFDIMLDENTFKSTYDIIVGIGEKWNKLSDINQASLLEKMAGKRQGNALAAALNNIEDIKAAYQTAENSAGSAMKEQEEYMKGIQYSLDVLKATSQSLATTLFDSNAMKSTIDGATSFLEILEKIVNTLGVIPTIIGGIGIGKAFTGAGMFSAFADVVNDKTVIKTQLFGRELKGIKQTLADAKGGKGFSVFVPSDVDTGKLRAFNSELLNGRNQTRAFSSMIAGSSEATQDIARQMLKLNSSYRAGTISLKEYNAQTQALVGGTNKAAVGAKVLGIALNAALSVGIMLAISLVIKGLDKIVNRLDKLKDKADEAANAYQETVGKIEEINTKLAENKKLIEEINKNPLNYTGDKTLTDLQSQNIELERQKNVLEEIAKIRGIQSQTASEDYLRGGNSRLAAALDLFTKGEWKKAINTLDYGGGEAKNFSSEDIVIRALTAVSPLFTLLANTDDYLTSTKESIKRLDDLLGERNSLMSGVVSEDDFKRINEINTEINTLREILADNFEEINIYKNNFSPDSLAYKEIDSYINKYDELISHMNENSLYDALNKDFEKAKKEISKDSQAQFILSGTRKKNISQDIQDMFDFSNNTTYKVSGNAFEQQDKLDKIITQLQSKNSLTSDEEKLLKQVKKRYEEINDVIVEYGDAYLNGTSAQASILLNNYSVDNQVSKETYESWREGLIAVAKGDTQLEKDLTNILMSKFPDFEESYIDKINTEGMNTAERASYYSKKNVGIKDTIKEQADAVEDTTNKLKDLAQAYEDTAKAQSVFSAAIKEQNKSGSISVKTYTKIMELGEDYAGVVDVVNGKLVLNIKAFEDTATAEYKTIKASNELTIANNELAMSELKVQMSMLAGQGDGKAIAEKQKQLHELWVETQKLNKQNLVLDGIINSLYDTEEPADTSAKDPYRNFFDELEHNRAMDVISEKEYLDKLEELNEKYYANQEDYLDEYNKNLESVYAGRKKLVEEVLEKEKEATEEVKASAENLFDDRKKYYEDLKEQIETAYDAEIAAIDKVIEAKKAETEELEKQKKLTEAITDLENERKQRQKLVFSSGNLIYTQDDSKLKEKREAVEKIKVDMEIDNLEAQKENLEVGKSSSAEYLDVLISSVDEQKDEIVKRFDTLLAMVGAVKVDSDEMELYQKNQDNTAQDYINLNKTTENGLTRINGKVIDDGSEAYKAYTKDNVNKYFANKFGISFDDIQSKITANAIPSKAILSPKLIDTYGKNPLTNVNNESYISDTANTTIIQNLNLEYSGTISEFNDFLDGLSNIKTKAAQANTKK